MIIVYATRIAILNTLYPFCDIDGFQVHWNVLLSTKLRLSAVACIYAKRLHSQTHNHPKMDDVIHGIEQQMSCQVPPQHPVKSQTQLYKVQAYHRARLPHVDFKSKFVLSTSFQEHDFHNSLHNHSCHYFDAQLHTEQNFDAQLHTQKKMFHMMDVASVVTRAAKTYSVQRSPIVCNSCITMVI